MTWNRSKNDLIKLLEEANIWHSNIKLDYKVGQCLPFLDVLLTNNNGTLETSVYHKPAGEPYVVPCISDHPRHIFENIIQTSLTRTVRYSSTHEAFQNEQRYIRLMLLYNGYPSSFIDKQFRKFFIQYIPNLSLLSFLPITHDEQQFKRIRRTILAKPTTQQSQTATSAAIADIDNEQTDESSVNPQDISNNDKSKNTKFQHKIIVHYTHEKRFSSFKRDMHHIYDQTFPKQIDQDMKMIVGNRNRRDARKELIRKRPKLSLLKNKTKKSNFFNCKTLQTK